VGYRSDGSIAQYMSSFSLSDQAHNDVGEVSIVKKEGNQTWKKPATLRNTRVGILRDGSRGFAA